jgi:septum formation protein
VLGADTDVALDGDILGKPRDAEEARAYPAPAGGPHPPGRGAIALRATARSWRARRDSRRCGSAARRRARRRYVGTGEWRGSRRRLRDPGARRGARGSVAGDYLNVVGLPLARLSTCAELLPQRDCSDFGHKAFDRLTARAASRSSFQRRASSTSGLLLVSDRLRRP